jgi:uncharacterized protein YqeY
MIVDDIKKRITEAMKARRQVEREILRLALSEIQNVENRTGTAATDDEATKIIKKLIKSNGETIAAGPSDEIKVRLTEENVILESLIPKTWDVERIAGELAAVAAQIKAAGSDGQATGVAMKHLKSLAAPVEGKDVGEAVKRLRTA